MFMRIGLTFAVLIGVVALLNPLLADDKTAKANAQAKGAVEAYLKAFKAEDTDAVMKVSDVPFVMNDRGKVETEKALRQEFTRLFDKNDMSTMTFEVKGVGALDDVKGKLAEKRHAGKLKEILKDGDRVVLVDATFGKKRKENMAFAVTVRDGKARVIGMFD